MDNHYEPCFLLELARPSLTKNEPLVSRTNGVPVRVPFVGAASIPHVSGGVREHLVVHVCVLDIHVTVLF